MGSKKKAANPVEAARKAARAREVKKNKENRAQVRETNTLRKDTSGIEKEIRNLERKPNLSKQEQGDLEGLRAELKRIKDIKETFISKHPDQRKTVVGYEKTEQELAKEEEANKAVAANRAPGMGMGMGGTQGRNPKWSVHYDPIFNPYGAPPPGMPYLEKPYDQLLKEGLIEAQPVHGAGDDEDGDDGQDSSENDDDDDDDDLGLDGIVLPEGPPPLLPGPPPDLERLETDDEVEDDDIVMPHGPPPGKVPTGPMNPSVMARPPLLQTSFRPPLPPPRGYAGPPPPFGAPDPLPPMPPPGVGRGGAPFRGAGRGSYHPRPPRSAPQHTMDPLTGQQRSSHPSHQHQQQPSLTTSLSARPPPPSAPPQPPPGVIISAEPQLRDLKKEATVFVPAAIRKKRAQEKNRVKMGLPARIDAAPSSGADGAEQGELRPDLMQALCPHLEGAVNHDASSTSKAPGEYDKFLDEIGDLL